jgi:hypothetical protein
MADKLHAMVADNDTFASDPQAAIHDAFLAADEEVHLQLVELQLQLFDLQLAVMTSSTDIVVCNSIRVHAFRL